jgi:hypothetical protein
MFCDVYNDGVIIEKETDKVTISTKNDGCVDDEWKGMITKMSVSKAK